MGVWGVGLGVWGAELHLAPPEGGAKCNSEGSGVRLVTLERDL